MATENEELRLTVTLADNASAGLEKLQAQLKELGGGGSTGGNKHVEKLNEGTKALTETVSKMTGSFGEAFKSLGMLRLGFVGGVAGLAAFGYEMAKQMKDLGEYTEKLRGLGQLGKDIGVDPGAIKNISEQLKVFGVSAEQSEAALSKFAGKMAELQRDPRVRMGILQQTDPRHLADMNRLLDSINKATNFEDKLNAVRQGGEDVYRNARRRGESEERAADERRIFLQGLNYDLLLGRAGELKKRSQEEKDADDKRITNATAYATLLGQIEQKWENITELMRDPLFGPDSPLVAGLKKLSDGLDVIIDKMKLLRAEDDKREKLDKELPAPEGFWQKVNPFNERNIERERRMAPGLHPESQEQKRSTDENTEATKKLTEALTAAFSPISFQGQGPGGGGIVNASYTTGGSYGGAGIGSRGTTPRRFGGGGGGGGGGYSDLGSEYEKVPNGSHVGAGAGAGAGETPAAGGQPGGGGDPNLTGNAFLASQRARLKKEMDDNPELKRRFAAIIQNENVKAGTQVAESAMNRAAMTGRSMESILGGGSRSFYGPVRRGMIEPTMRSMSAKTLAERYKQIDEGLAGSNTVRGATDQGSKGDPNFEAGGQAVKDVNGERFGYWGGYKGVAASRRWAQQQQEQVSKSATVAAQPSTPGWPQRGNLTEESLLAHARRQMDAENGTTKVEGSGTIRVHVNAPKGTSVASESSGLFNTIETYRQTQMQPAERGPPRWGNPQQ